LDCGVAELLAEIELAKLGYVAGVLAVFGLVGELVADLFENIGGRSAFVRAAPTAGGDEFVNAGNRVVPSERVAVGVEVDDVALRDMLTAVCVAVVCFY